MAERARRVLSGRRKAMLALILLVVTAIGVELLFRGWLALQGAVLAPGAIREEIQEVASLLRDRIPTPEKSGRRDPTDPRQIDIAHPYVGFDMLAGLEQVANDVEYFRSPVAERNYDVLVLGGSVAGRFSNLSRDAFVARLRADPRFADRPIQVLGHGRGAHKQPQQATLLAWLLAAGYEPDAVINIDGFNEVAIGLENANRNGCPLYPALTYWGKVQAGITPEPRTLELIDRMIDAQQSAEAWSDRALRWHLEWSAVAGHLTLLKLQRLRSAYGDAFEEFVANQGGAASVSGAAMHGPQLGVKGIAALDLIARSWVEGSVSLAAMCDARSIHYLHVLQPTLHDEGAKPITPEEAAQGVATPAWIAGVKHGYPKLREAGKALVERGVAFRDCSRIFADVHETIYYDACHFDGVGNELFGVAVAEAFLDSLAVP